MYPEDEEEVQETNEDFYDEGDQESALDDDGLSPQEAAFMQGYEKADESDKDESDKDESDKGESDKGESDKGESDKDESDEEE